MKFAIEGDQKQFFNKHHLLEVQGILTDNQLNELNVQIDEALQARLKEKNALPKKIYSNGRDFWRFNDTLKKLILNSQFAEIASELVSFRPLRFGFDQLYFTVPPSFKEREDFNPYKPLMLQLRSLKEMTCIQGLLCGLMICLSGEDKENSSNVASIFSKQKGHAVFFNPEAVFDLNQLISNETYRYLMLVYTHPTAIYYLEENDPQTHLFKNFGYVFGDRLSDKLNPIVYRG